MALLLNIDTATEIASVCITLDGLPLALKKNEHQKEHASFVHPAIAVMLKEAGHHLADIEAFAVTSGPGSYTGLRVGMAAAKGFCYALSKPLITINTLEVMTNAAIGASGEAAKELLFCPMIDARRMEVFTAVYDQDMRCIVSPLPVVADEKFFEKQLTDNKMLFFGSGSVKLKQMITNINACFSDIQYNAANLGTIAEKDFHKKKFADISHSVPTYFKDFQSITKVNK